MAAYEVLLLNTAIPQIQAAQSGDTYLVPRDIAFSTVASFAAGAEATPSIVATGDTNTGIWFPAADTVAISTGGISRLRLDSFGNLGLGVTPSAKLEIYSTNNAFNALQVRYNGSNDAMGFGIGNSNGFPYLGYNTKSQASVDAPVYERSNPAAQLRMDNGSFKFNIAPSGTAGDPISFTQAMTLDASGNLLLGTTTARTTLTVAGSISLGATPAGGVAGTAYSIVGNSVSSGNANGGDLTVVAGGGSGAGTNGNLILRAGQTISPSSITTGGNLILESGKPSDSLASGYIAFNVYSGNPSVATERARITSGGYFKASNTGTYTYGAFANHEFNQSAASNAAIAVVATNASYDNYVVYAEAARNTTNNSFYAYAYYNSGAGAYKFRVADSGDVTNTNGTYGTISDAKMKTDIVDAGSQWSDIKALRFRKFKMKDDPSGLVQLGVVAQEVEQTSPGLVDEHADRDQEGNDLGTTTKSVKTSVLLMKAAVALQEAMARIEKLEAEVAALKGA